ncbi:unnamed protein product [Protopolystoma xenopodis]|uniref:Serine/threonine-protein kinase RIO1 n=1 Tax=Protopolystoma xenopodis TaxID=117903 RepID=A0A448XGJ3_9PLAT|nr:unnamed protein product [Protopolystoma xenopodis]
MSRSPSPDSEFSLDYVNDYDDIDFDTDGLERSSQICYQKFMCKVDFNPKLPDKLRDRSDRATTDHVLDKRSCAILFKMMSQECFSEISGCLSTGKEANVYHASNKNGIDFAIKVYMTSILPFKSRDKYVSGDFRMRHGYSKSSSWRLVSKWAEKEYRNLIRISQAGSIPAPIPIKLKGVVLQMSFIGKNGLPAPKLKDANNIEFEDELPPNWNHLYQQVVRDVRTLYQKCRLVHCDLSEYNILYMDNKAWIIDVSQAVEHESSQALEFLRNDCFNVNAFFRRQGVPTLTLREFFEWVVDPSLPPPDTPESALALINILEKTEVRGLNATIEQEDMAFRHVNIPRCMADVKHFVRDFLHIQSGLISPDELYYTAVTGLDPALKGPRVYISESCKQNSSTSNMNTDPTILSDRQESESVSDTNSSQGSPSRKFISSRRPRNESPNSRRLRKKVIKEAQSEKRKNKIPKYIKLKKKGFRTK